MGPIGATSSDTNGLSPGHRSAIGRGRLHGDLSLPAVAAIALSYITPTAGAFIIAPVAFSTAGSAAFLALVVAAVISLGIAYCYAELGSAVRLSGGEYNILSRVVSPGAGFVTLVFALVQGVFGLSGVVLGAAYYLAPFFPGANPHLVGVIMIGLATVVGLFPVKRSAGITSTFLVIELLALLIVSVLGFAHSHNSASLLISPRLFPEHGAPVAATAGVVFAGVTFGLYAFFGFGGAVYFSEETGGSHRRVAKAVIASLAVAVVAVLVPVAAAILGAPSLQELANSDAPLSYLVRAHSNQLIANVVSLMVALAVFNAAIAALMATARIIYAAGRDGAWPGTLSAMFASVHSRTHAPIGATVVIGVGCMILTGTSDLAETVTFTGVVVGLLFCLVATAACVSRVRRRPRQRPYKMPLWPLPPLVGVAGTLYVLSRQAPSNLLIALCIAAGAGAYYMVVLRRRWKVKPWNVERTGGTEAELEPHA